MTIRQPKERCALRSRGSLAALAVLAALFLVPSPDADAARRFPNILVVAVDTLRYDRLSIHGYERPTSPHIDALLRAGARFERMHVVEPLTAPSMSSIFTALYPHEHGATRNGLKLRPGLVSLPKILERRGYETAAFVGNWTLRSELVGLDEHFEHYEGVWSRKRYFGLMNSEATAEDLNEEALDWLDEHWDAEQQYPFFLWVHYVEPHGPYRLRREYRKRLRLPAQETQSDRYDTEVAFVDEAIGDLLDHLRRKVPAEDLLIVFVSDHGESLGEHGEWGHGRDLYQPTLHIPAGITWSGRIEPGTVVGAPASSLDLPSTVLGLLGLPVPDSFRGHDFAPTLLEGAEAPARRTTFHQAHKGAAHGNNEDRARRNGLLEVGLVVDGVRKETLRVRKDRFRVFDLVQDPEELHDLSEAENVALSAELREFLDNVHEGLEASDELPANVLTEEDIEQLRALGYID